MISDQSIQADLITKIKAIVTGTSYSTEVRELEWQGDNFTYPNLRLDLETNEYVFDEQELCTLQYTEFSIYVFSQERSSKECSTIKGLLATALVGLGFTGLYAKYSSLRLVDNVPAVREGDRTWRSQIRLGTRVQVP